MLETKDINRINMENENGPAGLIRTSSLWNANQKKAQYDEIWILTRYAPKKRPDAPNVRQIPELAPSQGLFREYMRLKEQGRWNITSYMEAYAPKFLREMHSPEAVARLNELWYKTVKQEKHIQLVCYCHARKTCNRRLIEGLLAGAGAPANTPEPWIWDWYRGMQA